MVTAINNPALCLDNQTTCGTTETTLDNTAPAPKAMNNAGKVQQIKVLVLEKKIIFESAVLDANTFI
jgi:hypothetical protein